MAYRTITVHAGQQAEHHEKLRATLEQKTLSILDAKGQNITAVANNLVLFADTLNEIGAIDGDLRRMHTKRASEYSAARRQQLENEAMDEACTIIGMAFILVAWMIAVCVPSHMLILKAFVPSLKDMDVIAELASFRQVACWLIFIGLTLIYLGSGFRSALAMMGRWKLWHAVAMAGLCSFIIFGLSWPWIQYYL